MLSKNHATPKTWVPAESGPANHWCRSYDYRCRGNHGGPGYDHDWTFIRAASSRMDRGESLGRSRPRRWRCRWREVRAKSRAVEVVRLRITAAGLNAIDGSRKQAGRPEGRPALPVIGPAAHAAPPSGALYQERRGYCTPNPNNRRRESAFSVVWTVSVLRTSLPCSWPALRAAAYQHLVPS
jgi:hypothetical protein